VRARGQELALEAAHAGTTLGGAIATNASGARRLRFGAPRDRILGARFVLGDGTLARSGGKVVKNVAGYGIHRMLCGACGALAVIVEASFKLMPGPERRRVLLYHATREQLADRTRWSGFARLEPAVLTVLHGDATRCAPPARGAGGAVVVVGFEDEARWLEVQTERATAALGAPAGVIEGDATLALWQSLADAAELRPSRLSFVTSDNSPSAMAAVLDRLGEDGAVHHALAGRVHLFPASAPVAALANRCAETGFTLVESRGVDVPVPALASPAAVFDLRARVRASLDPGGVLVLGTRWAAGAR
jgi:glycolate oxidase FAD binding subunit